jgi:hypothetical protein
MHNTIRPCTKSFTFLAAALLMMPTNTFTASAATVTFTLDLSVPNEFKLFAQASAGDNVGMSRYGVPLMGTLLTLDHRAPSTIASANFQPAGFSNLRSADAPGGVVDPTITGGQSLTTPNVVFGFGLESSNFVAKGITPIGFPDATSDAAWTNPMLIAVGTYDASAGTLEFRQTVTLTAGVYDVAPSHPRIGANIETRIIPLVPEPATLTGCVLATIAAVGFLRHRTEVPRRQS